MARPRIPRLPKATGKVVDARSIPGPPGDRVGPTSYKKGQSGNPKGRRPGARSQLSAEFLHTMLVFWKKHGKEALEKTLQQNPAALVATIARIIPKDFQLTITGDVTISHELSADQRRKIAEAWLVSKEHRKERIIDAIPEKVELLECQPVIVDTREGTASDDEKKARRSGHG